MSYVYIQKTIKQNIFDQLELAADGLREHLNIFLKEKVDRVVSFSSDGFIKECTEEITERDGRRTHYTDLLSNHLIENKKPLDPGILEVFVVDFKGNIIASTDMAHIGNDVSGEEYYTDVEFMNAFVGPPHYDSYTKSVVIDFSKVLLSRKGKEAIGIIVNRIKFEQQEGGGTDAISYSISDDGEYSRLASVNQVRINDFSSDGFIKDCTEEITRREDRVQFYTDRLNSYLTLSKQSLDSDIIATFVADLDGKIIASTEIGVLGKDISGDDCFSKTMAIGHCICDLHFTTKSEQNTNFEIARLLFVKEERRSIGVIISRFKGDSLKKVTRSGMSESMLGEQLEGLGETGELYIVNDGNLMITESRFIRNSILKQTVDTESIRAAVENGLGMTGMYTSYRDVRVLGVSRYIDEMDWVVLAEKSVSEAFAPITLLRNVVVAIAIVGMVFIVAVAIFISNGITRSIKMLMEGTKKIADGDLEYPIIIDKGKDEIKELGDSFNLMTNKLRESREENAQLLLEIERRGKDEWQKTFDVVTDIITVHDKDFRIIKANRAFYEKFNVKEEQASSKKCYEIFHGTGGPWPSCPLERTLTSMQPEHEEIDDPHMGGIFAVSTYPFFDEKGELYGVVHQARDITESKKAEEEILRGKEYIENLIETAQDAIVCINEKGIINVWNKSAERIFGYLKSEIIGQKIATVIPADILFKFIQMSKSISISKAIEISGEKKDGSVIPIEISLSSQKTVDGQHTFTIIIRDVTFQKEAKKQLINKANQLEKANKELEDFIYIMAHDLKEPLFAIGGYTTRISKVYTDKFDDKLKHYMNRVTMNVEKMSEKIHGFVEVMRAGWDKCDFQNNDIGAIIKEAVKTLEDKIVADRIDIIVQDDLPAIYCNRDGMIEVFTNLISNSIKFMHDNNDQKRIRIGCDKNNGYCKLFVEDMGVGIRAEYQDQIFRMFKKVGDVESEGSGVGLAMVKKIIELHNGTIWVESPIINGKGSRFCFTIPSKETEMVESNIEHAC